MRCIHLLVVITFSLPAAAGVLVTATYDGQPATEADVCFYQGQPGNPLVALEASEVHCLPTGKVLDVPLKSFGFYARRVDNLITKNHGFLAATGNDNGVQRLRLELSAAGHLVLGGDPPAQNEHLAAIIGESSLNHGTVVPLTFENGRSLVPADVPITPVLVRDGQPVWVGDTVRVPIGGEETLHVTRSQPPASSVIVSFVGDDAFSDQANESPCKSRYSAAFMRMLAKQDVPSVELIDSRGQVHGPEAAILRTPNIFDNLYVFRGVNSGRATLRVSGKRFLTKEAVVDVAPRSIVVAREAGRIALGSDIVATVAAAGSHATASLTTCDEKSKPSGPRRIAIWTCPQSLDSVQLSPALLSQCAPKQRRDISDDGESAEFSGIPAGEFLMTLERSGRISKMLKQTATIGETTKVSVDGDEVVVSGRVTRDAAPVRAHLMFTTGEAVTDANTGQYTALLSGPPGQNAVFVVACDDTFAYAHLPTGGIHAGAVYDIAIPTNEVVVAVRDAATGEVVDHGTVSALAMAQKDPPRTGSEIPTVERDGRYVVESVDEGTPLKICAAATGYRNQCTDVRVSPGRQEVTLSLDRQHYRGRVASTGYSQIVWARPDGTIFQRASIDADGTFTYTTPWHDEHAILIGTAPMLVTSLKPFSPDAELEIVPPAVTGTKRVRISLANEYPQAKAVIGLWINGLRVPMSVLGAHQFRRHTGWFVSKTQPLVIADLYANDTLSIAVGPDVDFLTNGIDDPMIFSGRAPIVVPGPEFIIR